MYIRIIFSISTLLILLGYNGLAQKSPIKFGKISKEELEMQVYDKDSSAPAVILCDYGYWNLNDYNFRRILRVKILTKEGLYLANKVFPSTEDTQIKGKTYNLSAGEIVKEKLKGESVFKERVFEDYWRYRVAMPNVQVGSVFEIEFTHAFPPSVWYFQWEIPVVHSELIIPESQYIDYRMNFTGYEPLDLRTRNHWIAKDVPAFKEESYTNSIENYITKFDIEILRLTIPGLYREFATDWDAVARRLEESDYFGGVLNSAMYLSSTAKEIEEKDTSATGRLKLALEAAKKVKWNDYESVYPTHTTLGMIYREGIGNSADINMILVNLLRKLDIESYPVIMSTRSNGRLPVFTPSRRKLNYIIAYAKIGDQEYLIDATEQNAPLGILPKRCLNGNARIVFEKERTTKHIDLGSSKRNYMTAMFMLEVTDDFNLKGSASYMKSEYAALNFRNYYCSFNSEQELIEDRMEDNPEISIENYKVEHAKDLYEPIKELFDIKIKNQVYAIDDQLYINPMVHLKIEENPFNLEERKYPVDFAYNSNKTYIIKIKLPEGYEVAEMPKPLIIKLPENAGRVVYQVGNMGNEISVTYKFTINKPVFSVEEYQYLREFYNQIIKKQSEPVILNKI
jgi:hypothetical protein